MLTKTPLEEPRPLSSSKALWQAPELTVLEIFTTASGSTAINENNSADNMAS